MSVLWVAYATRSTLKPVSKYCISTKHNSIASYYVMEVSFLPQKLAGLYPVRCDCWLYQIAKFEYGLAFSGVTFIPEFAKKKKKKKINWLNGIRKQTDGEEMVTYLACIFARKRKKTKLEAVCCLKKMLSYLNYEAGSSISRVDGVLLKQWSRSRACLSVGSYRLLICEVSTWYGCLQVWTSYLVLGKAVCHQPSAVRFDRWISFAEEARHSHCTSQIVGIATNST